ncbi:unnamed protein product [Phytophthora lilii]|uniref:Unnamed protein product n=1 Tax=Phytophthora lilii TaxID=2077276 RepID=A0A9W6X1R0_9STRA|nr:unnamed protein product [Phytophthora lilii]
MWPHLGKPQDEDHGMLGLYGANVDVAVQFALHIGEASGAVLSYVPSLGESGDKNAQQSSVCALFGAHTSSVVVKVVASMTRIAVPLKLCTCT